ncbi:AraC family transcriptional regulator [Paenibacillus sp. SYP-B3998]|nr:AraC family transcriptional regulator [Paenibacillus sp. SYP-B3998]
MIVNDHILLWNHASIKVLDVRHTMMRTGEAMRSYRLPASVFLLVTRGSAQVLLDDMEFLIKRFQVMHSGKGAHLDIFPTEDEFEYYMIFYKASLPAPSRQEMVNLLEKSSPFHMQYSFSPNHPISLFHKVKLMDQEWRQAGSMERFQVKSLFYQFVYSILQQLYGQGIDMKEPDLAAQAILYIKEHYSKSINLDSLAESLNYSVPHFSALFKNKTGYSPIDYLIRIRIDKAASLLVETDATLREIAVSVGYKDPYYFGRLFKKYKGVSPDRFRAIELDRLKTEDSPSNFIRSSIVVERFQRYIEGDNHYQYNTEGEFTMYKQFKSTATATLLLCFALLVSACSGAASNTRSVTGENQSSSNVVSPHQSSAQPNTSQTTENLQTKVVSTINGDIKLPVNPKRIVADQYLGSFIALGVTPIGTPGLHRKNPYFTEALKEVQDIGDVNGSLEKVIDLQPDLIVTGVNERYEQLSKIAPTVSVPYGELKNAHEELTYFGKLLGKEKEAEAWLADYDRRIAAASEKVKKAVPSGATFTIFELTDKTTYVYGDNFGRGGQAVYQALGFKPPAPIAAEILEKQWAELSNEVLSKYAGDYIILTSNDRTLEDIKADPIWSTLDAVKNNHVYVWKEERSWYYDPIAVLSQTEEIAAWLSGQR